MDHELRFRRKLSTLKQTGSVQAYASAFRNVVLELDTAAPNDGDLLFRFIEGLNDEVRREVYMERPTLLADAIALAERADSALFHIRRGGKRAANRRDQSEPMDWSYGPVANVASGQSRGESSKRGGPIVCWNCRK